MDRANRTSKMKKYIGAGLVTFGFAAFVCGAALPDIPVLVQYLLLIIVASASCVTGFILIKCATLEENERRNAENESTEDTTDNIPESAETELNASAFPSGEFTETQSSAVEKEIGSTDGASKDGSNLASSASNEESNLASNASNEESETADGVASEETRPVGSFSKEGNGPADASKEVMGQTSASKDEDKLADGASKEPADGSQEGSLPENPSKEGSKSLDGATKDERGHDYALN